MTTRILALFGAAALLLTSCKTNNGGTDGGIDSGTDASIGTGACSGSCGPNQKCDEAAHKCVDLCGGCPSGQLCVKNAQNQPECQTPAVTCQGNACDPGQTSCVGSSCSCLTSNEASTDTCAGEGRVCHSSYNAVTQTGGACDDPRLLEPCSDSCTGTGCGTCGSGAGCNAQFLEVGICQHSCSTSLGTGCSPDEQCSGGFCYPLSLFGDKYKCQQSVTFQDGDAGTAQVAASNLCLRVDSNGTTTESSPTGTCDWVIFSTGSRKLAIDYCRSPGNVPVYGTCSPAPFPADLTNTCGTGLECVPQGDGTSGLCMPICNANTLPDGGAAEPSCEGQTCVNVHRMTDKNTVVGACMQPCNVFSTDTNFGCSSYGTVQSSCVPTGAAGTEFVTGNGSGVCVPQRQTVAAEGQPCAETNAFLGAACASGLVCAPISGDVPRCVKPCDLGCVGGDAGVASRCSTEANATCTGGKQCSVATTRTGAVMGFCL